MRKLITLLFFITNIFFCNAQNFQGQWKGSFVDKSTSMGSWSGDKCDYVLDLEISGKKVTGYSYTYFTNEGNKYYTICRLEGIADKKKKNVEITEISRTKTNIPVNISNSFQVHKLTWRKEGDKEILEGTWLPAAGQDAKNTGYGVTVLNKRQLSEISPLAKKLNSKKDPASSPEKPVIAAFKPKTFQTNPLKSPEKPTTVTKNKKVTPTDNAGSIAKNPSTKKTEEPKVETNSNIKIIQPKEKIIPIGFEKRNNAVLRTVTVENATVQIELYDNGEVDGDSISLFYNGNVLLAHKRLTQTPITLEIPVSNNDENELVMYADNLGTLPPNTALMIVRDGNKRYEVRITSDLTKSGTIRFIHQKKE